MRLLLIHGMGRTPLSLALLGRRLSQQRHIVRYFGYTAFQESFDQIVGRLVATIRATADQHPYALIGHSLGGHPGACSLARAREYAATPSGDARAAEPGATTSAALA